MESNTTDLVREVPEEEDKLQRDVRATLDPPEEVPVPEAGEGEEKVGFLNCHIFEGTHAGTLYKKLVYKDRMRSEAIVRHILESNAAVFILAEVWSSKIRNNIIKGVKHEYPHSYYPNNGGLLKLDSGLIFLSKKNIALTEYKNYSDLSGWDWMSTKCIACIVTDDKIAYFATHLNAGGNSEAKRCRHENIRELFELYDKIIAQENIQQAIVVGDFNIRESDFAELRCVSETEQDKARRAEWLKERRSEYVDFADRMAQRDASDGLRLAHPDHLTHPCLTADHMFNSLAVLWSPTDVTRSRLDYFFVRGIAVRDSGAYFHWWAGKASDDAERRRLAFLTASDGPMEDIYPVSDHYGIWIIFSKQPTDSNTVTSSSSSSSPN